jgi:hypothetical protein
MKITFDPAANADLDDIFAWILKTSTQIPMLTLAERAPVN